MYSWMESVRSQPDVLKLKEQAQRGPVQNVLMGPDTAGLVSVKHANSADHKAVVAGANSHHTTFRFFFFFFFDSISTKISEGCVKEKKKKKKKKKKRIDNCIDCESNKQQNVYCLMPHISESEHTDKWSRFYKSRPLHQLTGTLSKSCQV